MKINKKCSCGRVHFEIPKDRREWIEDSKVIGWLWECSCKSTLFFPAYTLKNLLKEAV